MRDLLLLSIVIPALLLSLRKPWIGAILWTWLSIMNPHRYTYGIAYSAPLAAAAAACTVIGLLMTRDRNSPMKGGAVTVLVILMVWMTLSWLFGLNFDRDYEQWKKVMKIDVMLLVALMVLHSKQHIWALLSVCAVSLGLLGAKGGLYTIGSGGGGRVWGPPGSFIADNNEFALALVMTIPLLRFLHLHTKIWYLRQGLIAMMVLCAISALGSQSRGALLAISAMALTLWWRGKKNKIKVGFLLLLLAATLLAFMPDTWSNRMGTIQTYQEDSSAMGRINAWWVAWGIGKNYVFGVGFTTATADLFARFAPSPDQIFAAHSIYFQMMGNHGFVGLGIFLALWLATWRTAGWLRTQKNLDPSLQWTADLGAMCQVSIVGYMVGGAFLSLAYFDLPYNIMAMVVLTKAWVERKAWLAERDESPKWMSVFTSHRSLIGGKLND